MRFFLGRKRTQRYEKMLIRYCFCSKKITFLKFFSLIYAGEAEMHSVCQGAVWELWHYGGWRWYVLHRPCRVRKKVDLNSSVQIILCKFALLKRWL